MNTDIPVDRGLTEEAAACRLLQYVENELPSNCSCVSKSSVGTFNLKSRRMLCFSIVQPTRACQIDENRQTLAMVTLAELCLPTRSVLYIEDSAANVALVEHLITRRGDLKFFSACTGTQGIEMACEYLPAVILMDIDLPDINGYDVLKNLRSIPATAHIPVMALSAEAYFRQVEQGIAAGFCQYLTKPFKIAELMDALDTCLIIAAEAIVCSPPAAHHATQDSDRPTSRTRDED